MNHWKCYTGALFTNYTRTFDIVIYHSHITFGIFISFIWKGIGWRAMKDGKLCMLKKARPKVKTSKFSYWMYFIRTGEWENLIGNFVGHIHLFILYNLFAHFYPHNFNMQWPSPSKHSSNYVKVRYMSLVSLLWSIIEDCHIILVVDMTKVLLWLSTWCDPPPLYGLVIHTREKVYFLCTNIY